MVFSENGIFDYGSLGQTTKEEFNYFKYFLFFSKVKSVTGGKLAHGGTETIRKLSGAQCGCIRDENRFSDFLILS